MTSDNDFKSKNRPASCTQPPWSSLIDADKRDEILATIRRETIAAYGFSMDECPKRMVCFTKTCMSRPMPWKSDTAKPYLEKMKLNQVFNKEDELTLSNCDICPIFKTCKSTCAQVNDFMNRDKAQEPELVFRENLDNIVQEDFDTTVSRVLGKNIKVPWDSISSVRKSVIKKYLYDQKDFLTIAKELKLTDQARVKYEFYAGLTTLSEYGTFRQFLEEKGDSLTHKQRCILIMVYKNQFKLKSVAYVEEITKQAVQQMIARIIKKYDLKWQVFVRKENNKVIYNVPEILK